jgi:hypothetical protein
MYVQAFILLFHIVKDLQTDGCADESALMTAVIITETNILEYSVW